MRVLLILSVLFLSACGSSQIRPSDPVELPKRAEPSAAMVECVRPSELSGASFGDVVRSLKQTADLFHECSLKQKELKEWIERGR